MRPRQTQAASFSIHSGKNAGARADQVFIDFSTVSVALVHELGAAFGAKGVDVIDAPVTGSKNGAEKVVLISDYAREQQQGSESMVQAISEISRVATTNAEATDAVKRVIEEQTQAVGNMTKAAQELSNLSLELQSVMKRAALMAHSEGRSMIQGKDLTAEITTEIEIRGT